jgi:hypothetical protein
MRVEKWEWPAGGPVFVAPEELDESVPEVPFAEVAEELFSSPSSSSLELSRSMPPSSSSSSFLSPSPPRYFINYLISSKDEIGSRGHEPPPHPDFSAKKMGERRKKWHFWETFGRRRGSLARFARSRACVVEKVS